ncbi:MAG: hypothetical protein IT329_14920 [Caldilineaceae bacterium]|nr:hypothetical protein [Caldilineaceae bacterium]
MRKLGTSLILAALLIATLAFTVYSQRSDSAGLEGVRILEGGVSHQLPVDITLVLPTESGPQTVTVPILLNLNLTVGPIDAINLDVQAESGVQFISPLRIVEPLTSPLITSTLDITSSAEITGGDAVTD